MYKTNKERILHLILQNPETRILLYMIKVLVIILILFTIIFILVGKWSNIKQEKIRNKIFGSWDIAVIDINEDELNYFKKHAFIDNYAIQYIQDKIYLNDQQRIVIGSSEESFINIGNIEIISGRMPEKNNEVAVEKEYLSVLGVQNIGDIIPKSSPVKSLQGYSICGILSDYSSRWKMVNWDIKYINCFINKTSMDKKAIKNIQVFLSLNDMEHNDIETNYLTCYKNVSTSSLSLIKISLKIWLVIIPEIILIIIYLLYRYKISYYYEIVFKTLSSKILIFLIIVVTFFCMYSVIQVVNNVFTMNNYQTSFRVTKISDTMLKKENVILNDGKYIFVNTDENNMVELQYVPCKHIKNILDLIIIIFWVIVFNTILVYLLIFLSEKKIKLMSEQIFLDNYFFNNNLMNKKKKLILIYYLLEFLAFIFFVLIRFGSIDSFNIKLRILVCCGCIYNLIFLIRIFILKYYLNKLFSDIRYY